MGVPLLIGNVGSNLRDMASIGLPLTFADRIRQATGIDDIRIQKNGYSLETTISLVVNGKNGLTRTWKQIYSQNMIMSMRTMEPIIDELIFNGRKLKAEVDGMPEPKREHHIDNNIFNYIGV